MNINCSFCKKEKHYTEVNEVNGDVICNPCFTKLKKDKNFVLDPFGENDWYDDDDDD